MTACRCTPGGVCHAEAEHDDARVNNVDHGLPDMTLIDAFPLRFIITARASELGLIEAANRAVFHARGFALTRDPATGDLWLTPTTDPEGFIYADEETTE